MSYRISWQTRPRVSSVLGLPFRKTTAAEARALGMTGPMPIAAWSELLTRVKLLHVELHYNNGVYDEDFDYVIQRADKWPFEYGDPPPPATDPLNEAQVTEQFMELATRPGLFQETNDSVYGSGRPLFSDVGSWPSTYGSIAIGGAGALEVSASDENGGMWCFLRLGLGSLGLGLGLPIFPGDPTISANIALSSGTYPVEVSSLIHMEGLLPPNHSFTLTPAEWLPYKTSTGVDAWDTSTGLPINGGPGA